MVSLAILLTVAQQVKQIYPLTCFYFLVINLICDLLFSIPAKEQVKNKIFHSVGIMALT
jgi:hypothetical protein